MKLVYQYMTIFFTFSLASAHLHLLQVENCDSNSRLVADENDNNKFRLRRVNMKRRANKDNSCDKQANGYYGIKYSILTVQNYVVLNF